MGGGGGGGGGSGGDYLQGSYSNFGWIAISPIASGAIHAGLTCHAFADACFHVFVCFDTRKVDRFRVSALQWADLGFKARDLASCSTET